MFIDTCLCICCPNKIKISYIKINLDMVEHTCYKFVMWMCDKQTHWEGLRKRQTIKTAHTWFILVYIFI